MLALQRLIPADDAGAGVLKSREGIRVECRSRHQRETDEDAFVAFEDGQYVEQPVKSAR
ncbi:hypothetical protein ABZY03_07570 [Streptomyces klenkii]|uniref:hypothetical protein n=1 Tax=Streptomyces klenkii TaxID=1420899 RepID=UPI0033B05B08